jgi:hypothetical protein
LISGQGLTQAQATVTRRLASRSVGRAGSAGSAEVRLGSQELCDLQLLQRPTPCWSQTPPPWRSTTRIFGGIVQMKRDQTVPVFRWMVIESIISQYCGSNLARGMV